MKWIVKHSDNGTMAPVWIIVLICCLVEIGVLVGDAWFGIPRMRDLLFEYAAFWPGLWMDWRPNYPLQQITMFATYSFVHAGFAHLMASLAILLLLSGGPILRVGPRRFAAIYGFAVLAGAAIYLVIGGAGFFTIGAAPGLMGLMGAILAWIWYDGSGTSAARVLVMRTVGGLMLASAIVYWLSGQDLVWEALWGGFLGGWAAGIALDRTPKT